MIPAVVIHYSKQITDADRLSGASVFKLGGVVNFSDNERIHGNTFTVSMVQMTNYIPNIFKNPMNSFDSTKFSYSTAEGGSVDAILPTGIYNIVDIQDGINAELNAAGLVNDPYDPPFRMYYNETLANITTVIYNSKLTPGFTDLRVTFGASLSWMTGYTVGGQLFTGTTPLGSMNLLKINSQGSIANIIWSLADYVRLNTYQIQTIATLPIFMDQNVLVYPSDNITPSTRKFNYNQIDKYEIKVLNEIGETIWFMLGGLDIVISIQ